MPRAPRANKAAPSRALAVMKDAPTVAEGAPRRPRGRPRKESPVGVEVMGGLEDLAEHEREIDRLLDDALASIGAHLTAIRDGRLFAAAGYETFSMYCKGRWNRSRHWAYQLMNASEIFTIVSARADNPQGITEKQLRPLTPLADNPELVREAWDEAVIQAEGEAPTAQEVEKAAGKRRTPRAVDKRTPEGGTPHPAVYPAAVLDIFMELLDGFKKILDPFAGTGKIHKLHDMQPTYWDTVGIEIEPEWAGMHERTKIGSALELPFPKNSFDAIATSPTYGNRFADNYDASDPEARRNYRADLGRELTEGSSGGMQWGGEYRDFHQKAWDEILRVLKANGRLVLNIKDHIRDHDWQDVAAWHVDYLVREGNMKIAAIRPVAVSGNGMPFGSNADARVAAELVVALDKIG
jgi:SAM-dependent methyltransferase